ncbi:hypothetical protein POTOM_046647 [Populus tomentosa]|uniref:Uncharacterized protein n=1 Tax=Populus tomentosa TaxID=118781 RepID=A0A8X8CE48_POPTO|nr:hypothetical protein POTOM_046647 [Populus tomentosa]
MEFVNPEGLRLDGRRPMEMRQLRAQIGAVAKADGSAVFEMGNTKVIAAVYGPREVQNRSQQINDQALVRCEYSMANFSTGDRRRKPKGDRRSTEISLVIRQTMEECILTNLMPRSQIDIYVQVLQADGGTRSACINAATLALADAGIPMRDLVTSCSAGFLNSTPLLDLNYIEDSAGGPDVTVGILPKLDKVTLLQMDAKLPIDTFENVMQLAVEGCKAIANYIREVSDSFAREYQTAGVSTWLVVHKKGIRAHIQAPNPCLVIVGLSVVKSSLETCCIYRSCHLLSEFNSVNLLKS